MGNVHTERCIFTPGLNEDRCEGECGWRSCEHSVGATAPGIGWHITYVSPNQACRLGVIAVSTVQENVGQVTCLGKSPEMEPCLLAQPLVQSMRGGRARGWG